MFIDWKEIYLTSTIPVLCYRALFLTFSKNSGRRVFFEDLRDVNRFFILTTNKYTKKQIHILDPLVCNTPSSSTEQKIPMALLVFYLTIYFDFVLKRHPAIFFLYYLPQAHCFQWKFSLRIMKDIFPVGLSLPWTKFHSAVRSMGNKQATLTVWNKMYNSLQLDLLFLFFFPPS